MSLIDNRDDQESQLVVSRAFEAELLHGPDVALKTLGPPTDPIRMRATLRILIRADRNKEAASLVSHIVPDPKWIDLATYANAVLGESSHARGLVDKADNVPDLVIVRRTRIAFAEGVIDRWRQQHPDESLLADHTWNESDIDLARDVVEILDPLLSLVKANRSIQGDLQLLAVIYATECAHIARDKNGLRQFAGWLTRHIPVPLIVAELSVRKLIECPANLDTRLRTEHGSEFRASFLAAIVERELFNRADDAFDAFLDLSKLATTEEEKLSLCLGLFEAVGKCLSERIDQAIQVVSDLRPTDSRLIGLLHVFKLIDSDQLKEAKEQLEHLRDDQDGVWWQVNAQLSVRLGDEAAAELAWAKASELMPHRDVIRRSVQASFDRRKYESAVRGLSKLLACSPDSVPDLRAMAHAMAQLGDHAHAIPYLERLVNIDNANPEYRIGLAQCLARTAKVSAAVEVLKPVCDGIEPPLDAVLFQSELLEANGNAVEGFQLLDRIAADHWDEPRFLLTYMHRGHAAGEDRLAHEAFVRLVELRAAGKVPLEMMQEGTLEQLLQHGEEFRNQREYLQEQVVAGKLPWLFAEDVLRNAPTWTWTLHTQQLKWNSEEPQSRAALSIYATNGFSICVREGKKRITRITAPEKATVVICDLSALLTLHALNRLNAVAEFFGQLILPASYGDLRMKDDHRFGLHQPSREAQLLSIRNAIEKGRIHLVEGATEGMVVVDEYETEPDRHVYRLQDLLDVLQSAHKATATAIDRLREVAHRPSAVDANHSGIKVGASLLVDLLTLRTLAGQEVFDVILEVFIIHLDAKSQDELHDELQAHQTSRAAKASHDSLWSTVADLNDRKVLSWVPTPQHSGHEEEEGDEERASSVHLDSIKLSSHLGHPVIVDDRVLQVMLQQVDEANGARACGSDQVLWKMLEAGHLQLAEVAEDFRQLMKWRYRFLVPSAKLLHMWARDSIEAPPGDALLDVAYYLHDCLRDPGLHCGFEQTDPPLPMAAKLVNTWVDSIGWFLAKIWADAEFTDNKAIQLTRWIAEELIPSCPRGLWWQLIGLNVAKREAESVLQMALVSFVTIRDHRRANLGLRTLGDAIGLDEHAFITIAMEAVSAATRRSR